MEGEIENMWKYIGMIHLSILAAGFISGDSRQPILDPSD